MFALRRVAAKAVFTQPTRQLSNRKAVPRLPRCQLQQPTLYRSFHQSWNRHAEEEQKKSAEEASASPAEAETSGETVTTEPSEAELQEVKTESVATPDLVQSAKESAKSTAETVPQEAQEIAAEAKSRAGNVAEQVQNVASSAAQTMQRAASSVGTAANQNFPPRGSGASWNAQERVPTPSKILYIGNLFFEVTTPQLEAEFSQFGHITNSRIVTDGRGLSKGFAYIEFATQDSADRAVRELDQKVFQGRRIAVQYHVRREPRNPPRMTSRASNPASKTLFIGNMSYQMSDRDLNDLFKDIRNVLDVRVAIDRRSGQPRGFAHADFIDIESAQRAKADLETKVVYGRQLRIDFSASTPASHSGDAST